MPQVLTSGGYGSKIKRRPFTIDFLGERTLKKKHERMEYYSKIFDNLHLFNIVSVSTIHG